MMQEAEDYLVACETRMEAREDEIAELEAQLGVTSDAYQHTEASTQQQGLHAAAVGSTNGGAVPSTTSGVDAGLGVQQPPGAAVASRWRRQHAGEDVVKEMQERTELEEIAALQERAEQDARAVCSMHVCARPLRCARAFVARL